MKSHKIQNILQKMKSGQITPDEWLLLEEAMLNGEITENQIPEFSKVINLLEHENRLDFPISADFRFNNWLEELRSSSSLEINPKIKSIHSPRYNLVAIAAGIALLLGLGIGFLGGKWQNQHHEYTKLEQEVKNLKEYTMMALLDKQSSSDRIKAVQIAHDLKKPTPEIIEALFATLNYDENINVRLSSLEVIREYIQIPSVRAKLIQSITTQDSPLVQLSLAELMISLKDKNSYQLFQSNWKHNPIPQEIQKQISDQYQIIL